MMTKISGNSASDDNDCWDLCEQGFLRVVIKITERSARMSEDLEGM